MCWIQVYHLQAAHRMKLLDVVFDRPIITTTMRALGLPLRAPPIAMARSRQLLLRSKNTLHIF
jgi:hypothetical protein